MTIVRRSHRIDTINNRRSRRIAAKATAFLPSMKHTNSRKIRSNKSNKETKVAPAEKLSKTLRSRTIYFKDFSKKSRISQDSKNNLNLRTPERKSIRALHKAPSLRRIRPTPEIELLLQKYAKCLFK